MEKNRKVPIAIVSCFLIAFVLQGLLKMCGIFVFEKVLSWDIFTLIDNNKVLYIINNSLITCIIIYCLSFIFTTNWYSKKWYHYILIIVPTVVIITIKSFVLMPMKLQFVCDILLYIIIPLIIYFTTSSKERLFEKLSVFNVVTIISLQIFLYYGYLGLTYWSHILNSLIPVVQFHLSASTTFLVYFEVYMAEILIMLSCNFMIREFKGKEK